MRAHVAAGLGIAVLYLFLFRQDGAPWLWVGLWIVGFSLAAGAPFRPELSLAAYLVIVYGTPRYSELFDVLARSNFLHLLTFLAGTGTALWLVRNGRQPWSRSPLLVLAFALFAWGCISALVPRPDALPVAYGQRHSPMFFAHALILLVLASQVMDQPGASRNVTLTLCIGLALRILWEGRAGLKLEGDIGPLVAMVLPLSLAVAQTDTSRVVRMSMLAAVAGAILTIALTYNRAAAVALAVVLTLVAWRHRRNRWVVGSVLACGVVAAFWLPTSPYWARFQGAWKELSGEATGSVTERFDLWKAGLAIVADHPVVGVGPSNYPSEVERYSSHQGIVAHNSFVQMAAETGFPGLLLYLALFATALVVTERVVRSNPRQSSSAMAGAVQIGLVAYLSAGLFISRHDMVLAYLLVGWAAALSTSIVSKR